MKRKKFDENSDEILCEGNIQSVNIYSPKPILKKKIFQHEWLTNRYNEFIALTLILLQLTMCSNKKRHP